MSKSKLVCRNVANSWRVRSCVYALLIGVPGIGHTTPAIEGLVAGAASLAHDSTVTIAGSGFGTKDDSAPVLVDYVNEAFENGKRNTQYSAYEDGRVIQASSDDPESRWGAATSVLPVRYDTDSEARHPFDSARYHLFGENVWLGRPVAYGGPGGWDTPTNNDQLYLSWWVKVDHNSLYYWRIYPYDISGKFEVGEAIVSGGQVIGEFIGIDDEGLLNFTFPGNFNSNNLKGINLLGQRSGARTKFPEEFRAGSGYGFESPGQKTLRVWDDPDSRGIRTSLSHTDYFVASPSNREYMSNRVYQRRDMVPDVWHHFEVELDIAKGTFKSWFNGELGGVAKFDSRAAYEEAYSPTIALIGNNAKQDHLQNMYISEIYMDKSVQRVIIGDAPRYEDLTYYELQRPIKWTNSEIEFVVNLGALASSSDLYIYVFDEDGVPNQQGFELCTAADCPVPPRKIELQIN
ncbi:hypothetical protein FDP08_03450 [Marinobacter panjinensis]|uniref:Uncharacterized protein n=1 Tax=Marinobacter panjinensis TaxID=2576384 RepID=A0A4U6R169_9GAMM|nr:hypothetical protein [Marinobacter panjinensis]MCR8915813.1 hypothetical protein [Marinobacter panjinensis]TKV67210.1 hypothetical protein FDP08_03450 [Marinobacter panjinensis]